MMTVMSMCYCVQGVLTSVEKQLGERFLFILNFKLCFPIQYSNSNSKKQTKTLLGVQNFSLMGNIKMKKQNYKPVSSSLRDSFS